MNPFSSSDLKDAVALLLQSCMTGRGSRSICFAHLAEFGIIPLKKPAFPTFQSLKVKSAAE